MKSEYFSLHVSLGFANAWDLVRLAGQRRKAQYPLTTVCGSGADGVLPARLASHPELAQAQSSLLRLGAQSRSHARRASILRGVDRGDPLAFIMIVDPGKSEKPTEQPG